MTKLPLPRPGSLGLIQYAGVDMYKYADTCVDAATGSMAEAQTHLMTENKALREQVRDLENTLVAENQRKQQLEERIKVLEDALTYHMEQTRPIERSLAALKVTN